MFDAPWPTYTIRRVSDDRVFGYSYHSDTAHDMTVALSLLHPNVVYAYETASVEAARYKNGQRISK